jgi:hypothetical protein
VKKWYTVFIDEYVYHSDPKGDNKETGDEVLWGNYVNQENRRVDLYNELMFPAKDKETFYIPAIYSFSQRSIQTHYKDTAQGESAFGTEHINEGYGLNFDNSTTSANNTYRYNGRFRSKNEFMTKHWSDYVQLTVPDDVPRAINAGWNNIDIPAKSYPVPMLKPKDENFSPSKYFPNSLEGNEGRNYSYYAQAGCLNRNRDEDGNNNIDGKELKWYVPSSEEYLQLAIGQLELPTPLINFIDHQKDEFTNVTAWTVKDESRLEQQYHYWTSDDRYFWGEQGMGVGNGQFLSYAAHTVCYQVRCARQLGLNPATMPNTGSEFAYNSSFRDVSDNDHIYIEATYFTDNCIRQPQSDHLKPHDTSSVLSLPPYKFEVSKDMCYNITGSYNISVNSNGYLSLSNENIYERYWYESCNENAICGQYTQEDGEKDKGTWRVPNIRELAMMRTLNLVGNNDEDDRKYNEVNKDRWGYGYYLSCTYDYFEFTTDQAKPYFKYKFLGKRGDDNSLARNMIWQPQEGPGNTIHVRCVRDVLSDDEFEWKTSSNARRRK